MEHPTFEYVINNNPIKIFNPISNQKNAKFKPKVTISILFHFQI